MSWKSVAEIKRYLEENPNPSQEFLAILEQDQRAGVQKLYLQLQNKRLRLEHEIKRTQELYTHEESLKIQGYRLIAGIDEVGRGPLAGPVVTAVVILPINEYIYGLKDSKVLSSKVREELTEEIKAKALYYAYGIVEAKEIDEINIYQATLKAMSKAVEDIEKRPDFLLIDALKIPQLSIPQLSIIGGDGKSASIAAASILAKTYRDQLMVEYDNTYPQYGFASNKGYGTKEHIEAIEKYGHCPIHRKSFKLG